MTCDDLPSDEILSAVPGIFQGYVQKAYELRITIMGRHVTALRMETQQQKTEVVDWRYTPFDAIATSLS